ncbi:DUF1592 domain-containing protein [Telmatocola sphagniphila]|uniref:DUF1592 domain-containing protein n=1 Tax=Telmatocola sphagniphila TaxID=1123043 RepID=A0A8E6EUS9_9BACT|nr:DUF1592 domain-containing protein [Telmatocola sphagniphila]QVL31672.1 DUF1592 domain-containing protein [Telmatocola sphagniphila]
MKRLLPAFGLLPIWGLVVLLDGSRPRPVPPSIEELAKVRIPEDWTIAFPPRDPVLARRELTPLLNKYCLDCHSGETPAGEISLESMQKGAQRSEGWTKAATEVRLRTMPPPDQPQPDRSERETLGRNFEILAADSSPLSVRRFAIRRLNRTEYANTIRDLFGLDFAGGSKFPADDVGYDFDNIADLLTLSPLLIERYCEAAEEIVDAVFRSETAKEKILNPAPDPAFLADKRQFQAPVRETAVKRLVLSAHDLPPLDPKEVERQRAYEIFRSFGDRAYRRPILHSEITRLLAFVESAQRHHEGFESGIRMGLKAMLCSPNFLFHFDREEFLRAGAPRTDFALASRLSYFLWSSLPDAELFELAARGELHQPDQLTIQVQRMLRDDKARALATDFGLQWLRVRGVRTLHPDLHLSPDFDEELRQAMVQETELFLDALFRQEGRLLDLLDSDYTFVNERLARHYGIPGVRGREFRKVSLKGIPRGGILTQASVLTATSSPARSSPVQRGRWILEVILGGSPGSPPPGADSLSSNLSSQPVLTARQRLEQHRRSPQCASCHKKLDPWGLGLESFDALGAWRDGDATGLIEASGRGLPEESFRNPAELKARLQTHAESLIHTLTEKLAIYALGRGLTASDRLILREISSRVSQQDPRFSRLVQYLVHSELFQEATRPGDQP